MRFQTSRIPRILTGANIVYAKPPFGGPQHVLKYLARYTHRVAISDQRIVSLQDETVTFRYKDYRSGNIERTMTVEGTEFIRRFLQHVLPGSFHRIRYYGFLANRHRHDNLALARRLLTSTTATAQREPRQEPSPASTSTEAECETRSKEPLCPACNNGHMVFVETIKPDPRVLNALPSPFGSDTS